VSNAIKFSKKGDSVKISAKYISVLEDLTFKEEDSFIKAVREAKNGVLEIQV